MKSELERHDLHSLEQLEREESLFEERVKKTEEFQAGLKHIDDYLRLVVVKLNITLALLNLIRGEAAAEKREEMQSRARQEARSGLSMLEEISNLNVSIDQRSVVTESAGFKEAETLFHRLLLEGGAGFFEERTEGSKHARAIAKAVTGALSKFAERDDNYQRLFKTESLEPFWKRIVKTFFFVLAPENQKEPPYGIEEGEEEVYSSDFIKLPLSQAIVYYEEEILPMLKEMLHESPGDKKLQERIRTVSRTISEYSRIALTPRSQPLVLPKDYYTEGWTGYSQDGEPLVRVALPVTFYSGTNTDRMQELVKLQIVRQLAGKGLCPELDEHYRHLKSMESGPAGSSLFPGLQLTGRKGFSALKNRYPLLKQIDNKRDFLRLMRAVTVQGKKEVEKVLESALIEGETAALKKLE